MDASALRLDEFTVPDKAQWLKQIAKELKGADFSSISWAHPDLGLIEPVKHQEDRIRKFPMPPRSHRSEAADWEIRQQFHLRMHSNEQVIQALTDGITGVGIALHQESQRVDIENLVAGTFLNMVSLHIDGGSPNERLQALKWLTESHDSTPSEWSGSVGIDPLLDAFDELEDTAHFAEQLIAHVEAVESVGAPVRSVLVNAGRIFEAGGSDSLELAVALHVGESYLNVLLNHGISIDDATRLFEFRLSAGQSYFVTMAKFRAFRYAWARIIAEHQPAHDCSMVTWIHAKTSGRHFSSNDPHNNLLRATTAAMSALTGGCDSLEVLPYNPWSSGDDGLRLARNIHHLLREESSFDAVADPASGSHYVEYLTGALLDKAIALVRDWEEEGGLTSSDGNLWLDERLRSDAHLLTERFLSDELKIVGVNTFQPQETLAEERFNTIGKRLKPVYLAPIHQTNKPTL